MATVLEFSTSQDGAQGVITSAGNLSAGRKPLNGTAKAERLAPRPRKNQPAGRPIWLALGASTLFHLALLGHLTNLTGGTALLPPKAPPRLSVDILKPPEHRVTDSHVPSPPVASTLTGEAKRLQPRRPAQAAAISLVPGGSAAPPETVASPRIDLDSARAVARAYAVGSVKPRDDRFEEAPPQRSDDTPLAKGIAQAARPDCVNAYSGAGLLAAPLLMRDTLRNRGCKW